MAPAVSIVMPAYNAAGTIRESLDSIAKQSFSDFAIIVVDDKSRDSTISVVEAWRADNPGVELRLIPAPANRGPAAARNLGIADSQGEWLAFLDADDAWLPNRLRTQMDLAEREPRVDMWCGGTVAYCNRRTDDGGPLDQARGRRKAENAIPTTREVVLEDLAVKNPIATSSVLVRKEAVQAVGGFDESFCGPEDYDLWIRIAAAHSIKCIELPIARYRERSGSLSMDDRKFMPQVLRVIQKAYAKDGALAQCAHLRKAALMYQYDHAAWMAFCRGARWTALKWVVRAQLVSLGSRHRTGRAAPPLLKHLYQYLLRSPPERQACGKRLLEDFRTIRNMPTASIDLMVEEAKDNDPFYRDLVSDYYNQTQKRHKRFPLVRALSFGITLCELPHDADRYRMMVNGSARRNLKKAKRLGYRFALIDFNEYLDDIAEIRCSTAERQGRMPAELLSGSVDRCRNPPSKTNVHDYPYFGVLSNGGKLVAYAGCFVAGEACLVEHILGHADFQRDGIVPMLVMGIAGHIMGSYPCVKYYGYGTYFGAGESLRRFKRKLGFAPHWVKWKK